MGARKGWAVMSLVVDNYEGKRNKRIETPRPTLAEVTEAVKYLNGGSKSSSCMIGSDDSVFCFGGGPGGYHVSVTLSDQVLVLCDPTKPHDQQVNIIIGSIWTPLPADFIVDDRTALTAVESYFSRGTLAPSLKWVES
jgi:hypothetical protein